VPCDYARAFDIRGAVAPSSRTNPRSPASSTASSRKAAGRRANQLNLIGVLIELPCIPSVELYGQVVATLEPFIQASDGAVFDAVTDGLQS
jgi:hypothetical protein